MLENLQQLFKRYLELRLELLEADLKEQAQELLVKILLAFFYLFLASAGLLLALFGVAYYINSIFESKYLGFFVISGFFFSFLAIFLVPFIRQLCMKQINKYFSQEEEQ